MVYYMLQYSLVMTVSGQFSALPDIGIAVLKMLAKNHEVVLSDSDAKAAIQPMLRLPAHPDVRQGLQRLREASVRMVALTNSTSAGVQSQLEHAGISEFFESKLSVENIRKYKPHSDVYHWAAQEMQTPIDQCMLIAAHGWDIAGAAWAGMPTAFIARSGQQIFPLAQPAGMIAANLEDFAQQLLGEGP
jgi:2-haloacid dehalogenase